MSTVFVVATRTTGTGSFDWFWNEADADKHFAEECEAAKNFTSKGEDYKTAKFEHQTTLTDAEEITNEIDGMLCEYEEQYALNPPDTDE